MKLTKRQWFGLITLIVLLIAAYLVTKEPWKEASAEEPLTGTEMNPAAQ